VKKIEFASEDLAVFNDLVNIVKNNPKCFIFQEMVYGHTSAWKEQTGIETIDYYNQYFTKTVEVLKSNNLLDSTLLVITSDHGPRDNAYIIENYQIPLLFWANNLEKDVNDVFVSHLDLKDLLVAFLTGKDFTQQTDKIYTLGNSGELIYGMIEENDKYIFIHNRMLNLRTNVDLKSHKEFNNSFQNYLNYFESLRPNN
jgi:phosphoglycerol transferase MdoB-like AlkP superfamily enzyme